MASENDTLYGFSAFDVGRLGKMLRAYERGELVRPERTSVPSRWREEICFIAKTREDGIPAGTDEAPGKGTVDLYFINDDDEYESMGEERTAYNTTQGEVAGNVFIQIKLESGSQKYVVDVEDCSGSS